MYHITTKKASGVISGVQTSENGPIQWNRELPNTCLLSAGIKKHVTPLLAGYKSHYNLTQNSATVGADMKCLYENGVRSDTRTYSRLLEVNPQKMWSFERFFTEVTRILSKKKIHIFFVNRLSEHRVYLDKEERLENFQAIEFV